MRLPTVLLDVFAVTLFLYILYTVLALGSFNEAPEVTLPPIDLAQSSAPPMGVQRVEPVRITLTENSAREIVHHINKSAVSLQDLRTRLLRQPPQAVVVRIAATVRFGDVMPLLALLSEVGISNVTLAYRMVPSTAGG